jgi:hypothetical protein
VKRREDRPRQIPGDEQENEDPAPVDMDVDAKDPTDLKTTSHTYLHTDF